MFSTGTRFFASVALLLITISISCRDGGAQEISVTSTTVTTSSTTPTTGQPDTYHKDSDKNNGGNGGKDQDSGSKDDDDDNDNDDGDDDWWIILVGVLGGLAALAVVAVVIVAISKHSSKKKSKVHDSMTSLQQQQPQPYIVNGKGKAVDGVQTASFADLPPAYPDQLRVDVETLKRTAAPTAPILPPPYDDKGQNVHQHYVQVMPGCNVTFYENKLDFSDEKLQGAAAAI